MAGDWIKMRHCVYTAPEVVRISSALQADRLRTVGALYVLWCCADTHAHDDGTLPDYTFEAVDSLINWPGFAKAVADAGWLVETSKGLKIPNFERHNGKNARRRALDSTRKDSVRKMSASKADKKRTREEKRREENTPLSPQGDGVGGLLQSLGVSRTKADAIARQERITPIGVLRLWSKCAAARAPAAMLVTKCETGEYEMLPRLIPPEELCRLCKEGRVHRVDGHLVNGNTKWNNDVLIVDGNRIPKERLDESVVEIRETPQIDV